jgi:acyl-CoA hydrolase
LAKIARRELLIRDVEPARKTGFPPARSMTRTAIVFPNDLNTLGTLFGGA